MKESSEKKVQKMLKLKNGYSVEYDGTQYKLLKAYKKMTAKEKGSTEMIEVDDVKPVGYHANLEMCLKQYVRENIGIQIVEKDVELKDVQKTLKELHAEISFYS